MSEQLHNGYRTGLDAVGHYLTALHVAAQAFRSTLRSSKSSTPEYGLRQAVAPIHIISDFNDQRSSMECEQELRSIFRSRRILYEAPHIISDVEQFNITDGAFKIFQALNNLRRHNDTGIFVGVVDPGVGSERRGIVVVTEEGYVFVGPDNGLFSPSLKPLKIKKAFQIKPEAFKQSSATFHGRDQFTPLAAEIATGKQPEALGQLEEIDPKTLVEKEFKEGEIVEKDGYPNIKIWQEKKGVPKNAQGWRAKFLMVESDKLIRISDRSWSHSIRIPVANCFEDVGDGEWLVYEGSSAKMPEDNAGLLEIAIRNRAGKHGAGSRLLAPVGEILTLHWEY